MAEILGPALPEASRAERVVAGLSIAAAVCLFGAVAVRVAGEVELWRWWVPIALLAGVVAADFGSGLVHWAADTWGRADMPVIGRRVLVPFRIHHLNPDDFIRRGFLDTNGDVAALTVPVLLVIVAMPLTAGWHQVVAVFGLACCGMGAMTNQIHQWAHVPSPPRFVRLCQACGLLLRPGAHATHHGRPFDAHYCITTGWCNRPLEAVAFYRALEAVITRLTGVRPREDERTHGIEGGLRPQDVPHG
jgi:ubiquitin-conjugating enzyme E2 variant